MLIASELKQIWLIKNFSVEYNLSPVISCILSLLLIRHPFLCCCHKAFTIIIFRATHQSEANVTSWCYCIIFAYWLLYLCRLCFLTCRLQDAHFLVSLRMTTVVGALSHRKLTPAVYFSPADELTLLYRRNSKC